MKQNKKIWLSAPHMGGSERNYVNEAFETNWIAPLGPNVTEFEKGLSSVLHNKHIAALSSGTAALHLSLIMAGVHQGDTVICQSFTFSASANPIAYQGAEPVFVDSEADTWNMCPVALEKALKILSEKNRKPKAIIVVHLYGMPAKMDEIKALAQAYNVTLIEDAAEALGSTYKRMSCGTLANFGILSFNGNKIITTSGGGALVCNTANDKEKAVFLATQARDAAPHYQHSQIGYNYRMSNVVAGIGRGQLEVLEKRIAMRRANFDYYKQAFANSTLTLLLEPEGFVSNRWLTCVLTPSFKHREHIRWVLEQHNIESRPLWKPMHRQPIFENCTFFETGVSDDLFNRGLCLPSGSDLTIEELEYIVSLIFKALSDI